MGLTLVEAFNAWPRTGIEQAAMFGAFFTCQVLTRLSDPISSALFPKTMAMLTPQQRVDWNVRNVSTLHAIVVAFIAIYCMLVENELWSSPFTAESDLLRINFAITAGYLLSDVVSILAHLDTFGWNTLTKQTIFHHLLGAWGFSLINRHKHFMIFSAARSFTEGSTPFVNLRAQMAFNPKWKNSILYSVNSWFMVLAFFLMRIAIMVPYWSYVVLHLDELLLLEPFLIGLFLFVSLSMDALNIIWFYKILNGAWKLIRGPPAAAAEKAVKHE